MKQSLEGASPHRLHPATRTFGHASMFHNDAADQSQRNGKQRLVITEPPPSAAFRQEKLAVRENGEGPKVTRKWTLCWIVGSPMLPVRYEWSHGDGVLSHTYGLDGYSVGLNTTGGFTVLTHHDEYQGVPRCDEFDDFAGFATAMVDNYPQFPQSLIRAVRKELGVKRVRVSSGGRPSIACNV